MPFSLLLGAFGARGIPDLFDMKKVHAHRSLLRTASLLVSFCVPSTGHATSFNCHRAGHPTERTICAVPELSKLDDQLVIAWSLATQCVGSSGDSGLYEMRTLHVNERADAARLTFDAVSWNGQNSGREFNGDAVVRADSKALYVGADACQLDFAIRGAQLWVGQRGQCGKVLGHGDNVDFQGPYVGDEHVRKKDFVFE
ncbi:hypothetical protein [Burkholderia multivorans]|nr:hypothetical protein [Burkholderia multivorans]MCA8221302.1 hypothetical protein [Burkholderia multivorans]MCA8335485.1 hypothetical protein [Burkholderia multivorans]UXZ65165.1 hypothetical protein NUJ28_27575 [Burkholderia multivorans]